MQNIRIVLTFAVCVGLGFVRWSEGYAQAYPSKPVHWVVPFAPGGSGDALGRVMAQHLTEGLGQPVIVDNRPGGNTVIAASVVVKSPPDGYTVLEALDSTLTMLPSLYSELPYKVETDFAPVGMLIEQAQLLTSNPRKISAKSFRELVSYAKANPGKVSIGVGAVLGQLTAELLKSTAGVDLVTVNFKGGNQSITALLAGDIDLAISDVTPYLPHIKAGKVNALATTLSHRSTSLPDVPTLSESGVNFSARSWFGAVAPAGTPSAIVTRLNREINRALSDASAKQRLASFGLEPLPGTPEQFREVIRADTVLWARIIKEKGIKLE